MHAVPSRLVRLLSAFLPEPSHATAVERLRACTGVTLGLLAVALASREARLHGAAWPLLYAPLGASAVIAFAMPSSPLAQPWPILGGNVLSALVGVACAHWIADPLLAAPLAVGGALAVQLALRCTHPPGGAIALTAVLGGPEVRGLDWGFALGQVAAASAVLVGLALVYNNATRHRYPRGRAPRAENAHGTADAPPTERVGFTAQDLQAALARRDETLDVGTEDLEEILVLTQMQAWRRRFGDLRCADCMSRDVLAVTRETPLAQAWATLRDHKVRALPVVDAHRRVVGIVTLADFLKAADRGRPHDWRAAVAAMGADADASAGHRVADLMSAPAHTVRADRPLVELVPLFSDLGRHHLPVVDHAGRLVGMVTQSDLIPALFYGRLAEPAVPDSAAAAARPASQPPPIADSRPLPDR